MSEDRIAIEVAYAEPDRQFLQPLDVPPGTTAGQALALSDLARSFPALDLDNAAIGIWGHPVERDRELADGDRLEVYRPLVMDPREARRQLAAHGAAMGSHGSRGDGGQDDP